MIKKLISVLLLPGLLLAAGCQARPATTQGSTSPKTFPLSRAEVTVPPVPAKKPLTQPSASPAKPASGPVAVKPAVAPAEKPDASFTLVTSGDVLSHTGTLKAALQEDGSYDYRPMLAPIKGLLSEGEYTLVNLETAVAGEAYGYRGFPLFNAPVSLAQALKDVGVDMVATANNHAMDSGLAGLRDNLDNLDQIGLAHIGTYRSEEEAGQAKVLEINGIKVGFIATTNKVTMEFADDHSVNRNKPGKIRRGIAKAREQGAELIVFHIHWGKEYTEDPTQVQMDLYRILEEEGVDIVIGSHPHRLQPIELREIRYEGRRKMQALIWSTANLLWGQTSSRDYVYTGGVFRIRAERKDGLSRVIGLDYDLVYNLMWIDAKGKKQLRIIPEADKEQYKKAFPQQYEQMVREFEWAHETLARPVKLNYSHGASPAD